MKLRLMLKDPEDIRAAIQLRLVESCLEQLLPGAQVSQQPRRFDPSQPEHRLFFVVPGRTYQVRVSTEFLRGYLGDIETVFLDRQVAHRVRGSWRSPVDLERLLAEQTRVLSFRSQTDRQ